MTSQALVRRGVGYPYGHKVPKRVKVLTTVKPAAPYSMIAPAGASFEVEVSSYGAVSLLMSDGNKLAIDPTHFVIIEWF